MTIINFPTDRLRTPHTAAEKARILIAIVTGIRTLGEPCTADELVDFVRSRKDGGSMPARAQNRSNRV